jgi:hypothetical protein
MGLKDLELSKKIRGTGKWERVQIPEGLSEVDFRSSPEQAGTPPPPGSTSGSLSPAPGRPGQDRGGKRGRDSTGSQSAENIPKAARQEDDGKEDLNQENMRKERQEAWKARIEGADLVGEATISPTKDDKGLSKKPDQGFVTSVTGTPLKAFIAMDPEASPF